MIFILWLQLNQIKFRWRIINNGVKICSNPALSLNISICLVQGARDITADSLLFRSSHDTVHHHYPSKGRNSLLPSHRMTSHTSFASSTHVRQFPQPYNSYADTGKFPLVSATRFIFPIGPMNISPIRGGIFL